MMRRKLKVVLKYLLAIFFVAAGLNHFINPAFYLKIMPPYLPWHLFLIYLSGFLEIAFGILLLIPRFAVVGAWGIVLLLIAVYPANIHMAFNSHLFLEHTQLASVDASAFAGTADSLGILVHATGQSAIGKIPLYKASRSLTIA
ncbi:MAG: MauE/DoxX family redox-associated membrane protein [Pyrinomonadaceae bacterium]